MWPVRTPRAKYLDGVSTVVRGCPYSPRTTAIFVGILKPSPVACTVGIRDGVADAEQQEFQPARPGVTIFT